MSTRGERDILRDRVAQLEEESRELKISLQKTEIALHAAHRDLEHTRRQMEQAACALSAILAQGPLAAADKRG